MSCAKGCCASTAEHIRSVQMNTGRANPVDATERRWDRDMPAYKRLQSEGLALRQIDGSHRLEALANEPCEVEMGRIVRDDSERRRTQELYEQVDVAQGAAPKVKEPA